MIRLLTTAALVLVSTSLLAITPEELARLSEKGAADKRRVDQQLDLDDLHYKLRIDAVEQADTKPDIADNKQVSPKENTNHNESLKRNDDVDGKTAADQKRRSSKYSSHQQRKDQPQQAHPQNQRNARRQAERYPGQSPQMTPSTTSANVSAQYTTYSDAVEPDNKKYFGIRRGTWIKAELRRDINNAEPGDVELYLSQEIYGEKHTLPVDTQLFANKGLNGHAATRYADDVRDHTLRARVCAKGAYLRYLQGLRARRHY